MAWVAKLYLRNEVVTAFGGSSVENASDRWLFGRCVERPKSGRRIPFERRSLRKWNMDETKGRVVVCPPTHTLESVWYYLLEHQVVLVSNSPSALLSVTGDRPRYDGTNYLRYFETARFGFESYLKSIPLQYRALRRVLYQSVVFTRGHPPRSVPRPPHSTFPNFETYKHYVADQLRRLFQNATSPERRRSYPPLATISSGYDSPTCAVFAQELGCREAVSLAKAREQFDQADDSGTNIAADLGMQIKVFDRLGYLSDTSRYESLFLSTGVGGEDIVFASFARELSGRCVLTGFVGDKIWGFDTENIGLNIVRSDNGGGSLGEFRLQTDFVHIPIPFIGIDRQQDILEISRSKNMEPWRLGGDYDRPIARRIIEGAGVKRGGFGMTKKAVTVAIGFPHVFAYDKLHPSVAEDFRAFLQSRKLGKPPANRWLTSRWAAIHYVVERLVWSKSTFPTWIKSVVNQLECWCSVLEPISSEAAWLYHWSVECRAKTYSQLAGLLKISQRSE